MTAPWELLSRLRERARTMNGVAVGCSDGDTYAVGYYSASDRKLDNEAADVIESLEVRLKEAESALLAETERCAELAEAEVAKCVKLSDAAKLAGDMTSFYRHNTAFHSAADIASAIRARAFLKEQG